MRIFNYTQSIHDYDEQLPQTMISRPSSLCNNQIYNRRFCIYDISTMGIFFPQETVPTLEFCIMFARNCILLESKPRFGVKIFKLLSTRPISFHEIFSSQSKFFCRYFYLLRLTNYRRKVIVVKKEMLLEGKVW